ncbi:hypothetical protein [Bacillus toyonensis]|uniref:hypothetical protein n=1 Tax=Bacillus toyonensis TaxID=155322 RepID=UPI0015D49DD3|nr:hypothetical protein [Bacillus toyonensis]
MDNYVNIIKIATAIYIIKKRAVSIALFLIALPILHDPSSLHFNEPLQFIVKQTTLFTSNTVHTTKAIFQPL